MQIRAVLISSSFVIAIAAAGIPPSVSAAGASSDFGKTYCSYLKTRAMTATDPKRRKALMAEYRRCLKEHGEG